ncbi:sigma-70 family RNA polymerase sigma factor [Sphingomonas sp. AOB5]|uniref:RNA polymerase sigma factor n=1 Tax=Sphingomonas sp. AOB5 TaxID=3034017 RepID=UPI0023F7559E|nr:sigma-70 family RNA polymerase sigma factor [Sphingomonas sp. AOB5]MDF7776668.1 sigma-70 family RNA polymerase sigma factor [Sphingomonas sp. AOB5]
MQHRDRQQGKDAHDRLYADASARYAPALARLARATEFDADKARDLEQDMHFALWRSLAAFDGRCALGTWVYRVAHNVAATHAARRAGSAKLVAIEAAADIAAQDNPEAAVGDAQTLERLRRLIARLKPADRSVILLYLEGLDAAAIAEITGLTAGNVAVKIHRIKALLAQHFARGDAA